jgi:hypothetical protein
VHRRVQAVYANRPWSKDYTTPRWLDNACESLRWFIWDRQHLKDHSHATLRRQRRMLLQAFEGHSLHEIMRREEAEAKQLVKAIEHKMPWGQAVYRAWCDLDAKYLELLPFIHGIPGVNPVTFAYILFEHLKPLWPAKILSL